MSLTRLRAHPLWTLIAPPRGLVDMVRWAALLVVLLVAGRLLATLFGTVTSPMMRVVGILALAVLCCSLLRVYVSAGFSLGGCLFEAAALLVLGLWFERPPTSV